MGRNVTLKLDEALLKKCRQRAVEEDKSLSQWLADLIVQAISGDEEFAAARTRALKNLRRGFQLGGHPLSRDEAHVR